MILKCRILGTQMGRALLFLFGTLKNEEQRQIYNEIFCKQPITVNGISNCQLNLT